MNIFTYNTKGQLVSNIWRVPNYWTKVVTATTGLVNYKRQLDEKVNLRNSA